MIVELGELGDDELHHLYSAIRIFEPKEEDEQGVLLTCIDGRRVWQLGSDDAIMTIVGDEQEFEGDYHIPGRLISGAQALYTMEEPCRLTAADDEIVVSTANGTYMKMKLFGMTPGFIAIEERGTVEARVGFHDLQRITHVLGELPMDATNFDKMTTEPPVGTVTILDGIISFSRLWRYMGCVDTHLGLAAVTSGSGSFDVGHIALRNHVNYLWAIQSAESTIRFDPDFGTYLTIENEHFSIHLKRRAMGAARFFDSLKFFLNEEGLDFLVSNDGVIAVACGPVPVRMQFLDGESPILRCSVTVLHDVEVTRELLEEVNSLNQTRVGVRIWIDGDILVVGQDMRCEESTSYKFLLDSVINEAHFLGGLLIPVFGGTLNFTPDTDRP
jgi:hypothetical protein